VRGSIHITGHGLMIDGAKSCEIMIPSIDDIMLVAFIKAFSSNSAKTVI